MKLSLNPTCKGKDKLTIGNDSWQTVENVTPENLLQWAYVKGLAFAPGLFDHERPLQGDDKTRKADTYWQGAETVVLDIDEHNVNLTTLLDNTFIQRYAVAVFPSSSYTPDNKKWHIVFWLGGIIRASQTYKALYQHIADNVPAVADKALKALSQGVYGTVYTDDTMQHHEKSLDDGLCWYNNEPDKLPVVTLMRQWLATNHEYIQEIENNTGYDTTLHSENTRELENEFYEQPDFVQRRVLIDALQYAVRGDWGDLRRNERMPLIMAAHEASQGDSDVLDVFLNASGSRWDVSEQKKDLNEWWYRHHTKQYTVGTVFHHAKVNGWLQYTDTELTRYEEIHTDDIGDWLLTQDTLPRRMLIKSGTGSGKTLGAIRLLKQRGIPKSVFFAPSIKLCYDLSATLDRLGVENTLYIDDGRTLDHATLTNAQVLVSTLQTFATKVVKRNTDLSVYEFVVMDESDELISSFARADVYNTLTMASHVRSSESIHGLKGLYELMQQAGTVLLLDGTATQLSQRLLTVFSEPLGVSTYVNTWKRDKAPVRMSSHKVNILALLIGFAKMDSVSSIAVCCDTRSQAHQIEMYLKLENLATDDNTIVITGDTGHQDKVKAFLRDVNGQAQNYKFVIYNSAMGSGVSITSVKPDVMFQFAEWLTPRNLIQLLNRYRQQSMVFAYVKPRHSLFNVTADEKTVDIKQTAVYEAELLDLEPVERDTFALTREHLAQMAVDDIQQQGRAFIPFYKRLLRDDGRTVSDLDGIYYSDDIQARLKEANDLLKEAKKQAFTLWRSVPPVDYDNPPTPDMSVLDVARGRLHAMIQRMIPDFEIRDIGYDDETIARTIYKFSKRRFMIEKFLDVDKTVTDVVINSMNSDVEYTAFKLTLARIELIHLVGTFLESLYVEKFTCGTDTELSAYKFVDEVRDREYIYNLMCKSYAQRLHFVLKKFDDPVDRARVLARNILQNLGLSVRTKQGSRDSEGNRRRVIYIQGADDLLTFIHLVKPELGHLETLSFNHEVFTDWKQQIQESTKEYTDLYKTGDIEKAKAIETTMREFDTSLETAIDIQNNLRF